MAVRQRVTLGEEVTHVVLDRGWQVVEPVEAYLEYLSCCGVRVVVCV